MDRLKAIEEVRLSKTEEAIVEFLYTNELTTLKDIADNINVIYATICKELKKLSSKGVITIDSSVVKLTDFGLSMKSYQTFKITILTEFCKVNKLDTSTLNSLVNNKYYNNMKMLLGIKNLLIKRT
ncbi:MAG: hypothetical protein R3Y05_06360 [bacterium]